MSASVGGQSVDRSIGVEQGRGEWRVAGSGVEVVEHCKTGASRADFEQCAQAVRATRRGYTVEKLVAPLNQACYDVAPLVLLEVLKLTSTLYAPAVVSL